MVAHLLWEQEAGSSSLLSPTRAVTRYDLAVTSPKRVAVITGGASGFGRAVADQLLARGFDVAVLDIDGPRVEQCAAELQAAHTTRSVLAERADVA